MRVRSQQADGGHDHAVGAVSTLGRLFGYESRLHGVRRFGRTQALDRCHAAAGGLADRRQAGSDRLPIEQNRAGYALAQSASEFRSVQAKPVPQHI
jgi:hypothetical protein